MTPPPGEPAGGTRRPNAGALSPAPADGSARGRLRGGIVRFFHGPMDCGKSTLALQLDHNHARQGRHGLLFTRLDRAGPARISSRMGLEKPAIEVTDDMDLEQLVRGRATTDQPVDYVIADEAQFFAAEQIDQLARLADDADIDIYAFGITTDFRGRLFAGTARLLELADEVSAVQVEVLCWCGRPGRFNGRIVDGALVREGATVVVADTELAGHRHVRYQVLCRRHHRSGELGAPQTAAAVVPG